MELSSAVKCPSCGSQGPFYRDGLRYLSNASVQRWLCRGCGYRFSLKGFNKLPEESNVSVQDLSELPGSVLYPSDVQPVHFLLGEKGSDDSSLVFGKDVGTHSFEPRFSTAGKDINIFVPNSREHRVCATGEGAKNLETTGETTTAGDKETREQDTRGKLVEYCFHMQKQNASESTLTTFSSLLRKLVSNGADLQDPESIKEAMTKIKGSQNTKALMVTAYTSFLKFQQRSWIPPKYKRQDKVPYVPQECEIDALISGCSRTISAILLLLKETGMRIGEACRLRWTDINTENSTITVNQPEKGSNPRILKVSARLISMVEALPKKCEKVLGESSKQDKEASFHNQRTRLSDKLANPRLLPVTFHTLRHWKATTEYHKTHDLLHVQYVLGHRNVQNTMKYICVEQAIYQESNNEFHVKVAGSLDEACKLLEIGFEYVTDMDEKKLFRKRK